MCPECKCSFYALYTDCYLSHVHICTVCAHNVEHLNLTELGDLMQLQSLQICPTFASFKFTEYDDTLNKVPYVHVHGGGGQGSNLLVNQGW